MCIVALASLYDIPIALCAFFLPHPSLCLSLFPSYLSISPGLYGSVAIIYYVRENLRTPSISREDLRVLSYFLSVFELALCVSSCVLTP